MFDVKLPYSVISDFHPLSFVKYIWISAANELSTTMKKPK